ncbi:DUF1835 domain-containing protein [Solibacillus sp. MA9]|uniref:DUF1835 domain-containing protein n=1 Tax=Solibacillus palustris TaxID=2908203 RepID=A0ABS9UG14_9BACL|nr:DUF1835 domain-containing protein [Solibacillus sp. MA9]MCH7323315.1 DUF1835 domain-containing protein [Solibacillus sp. MA9]
MKHIIFGESAAGSLKFALKKEAAQIIAFPDYLGEGPIQELLTKEGLKQRSSWLEQVFRMDGSQWANSFEQAIKQLEKVTEEDSVLVWASENAAEQFGLRLICHVLQYKNCPIYFCDTYENMLYLHPQHNVQMEIRHTGEVSSEQFRHILTEKLFEQLAPDEISDYAKQAAKLMQGNSLLRTWRRGEIFEDVETRDDALIFHYLQELQQESNEEYIRAPRIIGHVLGFSVHDIHDTWIEYRLLALIGQGKVAYRGDLRTMRTYEVKYYDRVNESVWLGAKL